ncbi:MAG: MotA/TolQ/ExbB proton channel family protein [Verrucomicrobiota bacterium]
MPQTVTQLFLKGGGFMWPLLLLSILSLILILERSFYFSLARYRVGRSLDHLRRAWEGNQPPEPGRNPMLALGKLYFAEHREGIVHTENVAERESSRLVNRHERGLRLLGLIGTISPLIGLLGTVWGMVKAFARIAELGEKVTPADFADGIWTGLLTTVAGLLVAIPAVAASRIFEAKVDQLVHDLNEVASHLKEWVFGNSNAAEGTADS